MKILFSNPPWWEGGTSAADPLRMGIRAGSRWPFTRHATHEPDVFRFGGYLPFPFFLGYAAAYTSDYLAHRMAMGLDPMRVSIRDSIARGESYGTYIDYVRELAPDWIVIETATPSWPHDERVLTLIKSRSPESKIILAGPIDCAQVPAILEKHSNVVAVVQGEYDKQITAVIAGGKRGLVPHNLLTLEEMNMAPMPMFDEACALHYADGCPIFPRENRPEQGGAASNGQGRYPQLQVWTSRGCPFKCIFCVWPATMTGNDPDGTRPRAVRGYSADYMAAFLTDRLERAAKAGIPYRSIYFDDDTFNLTDKHVLAICPVMKQIGLPWSAMCRADTVKPDTWRAMKDAGCFGVKLGFESGSQVVIDTIINKRLNLAKALDTALWLRTELGMSVHGTFTIGLPGETPDQQQETRDFISRAYAIGAIDTHQLSGTSEIEGTPLHTLTHGGGATLAKYPGAHVDADYQSSPDGQRKIEAMR